MHYLLDGVLRVGGKSVDSVGLGGFCVNIGASEVEVGI